MLKEALLCCPENVTRECFLDALYSKRFWDVGIELGPFWRADPDQQQQSTRPQDQGCNQGMQYVCHPFLLSCVPHKHTQTVHDDPPIHTEHRHSSRRWSTGSCHGTTWT